VLTGSHSTQTSLKPSGSPLDSALHLCALCHIHSVLSEDIAKSVAVSLVSSCLEIEPTDRCCSETVTAQICSGRNGTEPHTQIRASRRGSLTPQTRDVRILQWCIRISPQILTTDSHPHSPFPTQALSRSRVSNPSEPGKLGH